MQPILPDIINCDQTAYIKGRKISDNIKTVWDIIDVTKLTKKSAYILFIDFEKAFDSVSFDYLVECLEKCNMGSFVDFIKVLYNDVSSCVSHKGMQSNYFKISRGVRQGDPLATLLFIIVLESFAETLRRDTSIKGVNILSINKKISLYADDMSLSVRDGVSCELAFALLGKFELVSGLKMNMTKTEAFSVNCNPISSIKIKWNPDEFKYLGILLCRDISKALKLNLERAMKIFKASIQAWEHRKLTFTGKKTILNTRALCRISHILVPLYVPQEFFNELNKIARSFLWNKSNCKVAFQDVNKPVSEGGLNYPNPELRIKSQKTDVV